MLQEFLELKILEAGDFTLSVFNLLNILIIFFIAWILVFVVKTILRRNAAKSGWLDKWKEYAIVQIVKYFVYAISVVLAIKNLGVDISIFIASSAALFVGIGFGLQTVFNDIVSGFILLFERGVKVGDVVEINSVVGVVREINIRTSKIKTREGIIIIVPNSKLSNDNVINWSHDNHKTRFTVQVGVAYGSDTEKVKMLLLECANKSEFIAKDPASFVRFFDFGDSALIFQLIFWTERVWEIENIKSELRFMIDAAFRKNNVTIPFPQRDLHVKSSNVNFK
jgi:small-conductance mechanosensitive channel